MSSQVPPQHFEEVVLIPSGHAALDLDAGLCGGLVLEEVGGDVSESGHVLGRVPGSDAAVVLIKRHIQAPVELVLNAPVRPDRALKASHLTRRHRADEPALSNALLLTQQHTTTTCSNHAPDSWPLLQLHQVVGSGHHPHLAMDAAPPTSST